MSVFLSFRCVKVVQCFKIMGVDCVGYEKNISHNGWRQNNRVECYNENNDLGSGSSSHPGHWKYWTGSSKKLELRSDSYALMGEDMKVQRSKAGWSWDNSCCDLILLALNSINQPACKIKVKHTCVLPFAHPRTSSQLCPVIIAGNASILSKSPQSGTEILMIVVGVSRLARRPWRTHDFIFRIVTLDIFVRLKEQAESWLNTPA